MNKYSEHSKVKENRKAVYKKIRGSTYSCVRKRVHETEADAYAWHKANVDQFDNIEMRAYNCTHCLKWHLTKRP